VGWPAGSSPRPRRPHLGAFPGRSVVEPVSKWFMVDTDFNIVFEADGKPLSAYEMCHAGPALQESGKLRLRLLGEPKPSLPLIELLPFSPTCMSICVPIAHAEIALGSPAEDLATWWTAAPISGWASRRRCASTIPAASTGP